MSEGNKISAYLYIALWMLLGSSLILFNKVIISTWGFNFPFFLACCHNFFATLVTQILSYSTKLLPGVEEKKINVVSYFTKIAPMALFFSMGLVFGNMSYKFISISYIQMIKAFSPVPLLLLNFMFGREKPSVIVLGLVVGVSAGVMLSSVGELNFSIIGFALMISAVLSDVIKLLLMDILLKDIALDSMSMLYYSAPISTVFIGIGFFIFEYPRFSLDVFTPTFQMALVANCCIAICLQLSVLLLISNTSAMVMSLAGPVKDIIMIVCSVLIFNSPVTLLQVFGFSISLLCLHLHKEHKSNPDRTTKCFQLIHTQLMDFTKRFYPCYRPIPSFRDPRDHSSILQQQKSHDNDV
eukprot:gene11340-15205_t